MAFLWVIPAILVLIGVDQLTKMWAIANLVEKQTVPWISGLLNYNLIYNEGVAWSMLEGKAWIFIPLSLLIATFFVVVLVRSPLKKSIWFNLICALILSGAIGNLIDRIFQGKVTDFISFAFVRFPTFNFADCCVVIGAILLFIAVLFGMKKYEEVPLRTLLFNIPVKEKEPKEQNDG